MKVNKNITRNPLFNIIMSFITRNPFGEYIVEVDDTRAIRHWIKNWWITSFTYIGKQKSNLYLITIPDEPKDAFENIIHDSDLIRICSNDDIATIKLD